MSIVKNEKDHLGKNGGSLTPIPPSFKDSEDRLMFWTLHDVKPCFVDLSDLAHGQILPKKTGQELRWTGGYSGRPELIQELAPAIYEKLNWAAERTCFGFVANLKIWWRLLDEIERTDVETGTKLSKLTSVRELSHLHQQIAAQRLSPVTFSSFRSVADATRRALGLSPLAWVGPGERKITRQIPLPDHSKQLFIHIKRGWLNVLDRWRSINELLEGRCEAKSDADWTWLVNARHFRKAQSVVEAQGRAFVTADDLLEVWRKEKGTSKMTMLREGFSTQIMYEANYPNSTDIRMAFHLALIGGGWNVQTLLDLRVNFKSEGEKRTPFLKSHPKDSSRYVLTGFKARGKSNHVLHGDWKSDRSPGAIIQTLVERTWPLRRDLVRQLHEAKSQLSISVSQALEGNEDQKLTELRKLVTELERKASSVWLCIGKGKIEALSAETFDKSIKNRPFLKEIIDDINARKSNVGEHLPRITAGDFRDIFAGYIYRVTGGSILSVKRLLGHRSVGTTTKYLDNDAINSHSSRTFTCYTNEMWQMCAASGRIDHTLLRHVIELGEVSPSQLMRLEEYRKLKKSRLNIGCKSPTQPPPRLDPEFKQDGIATCTVQRCTLCVENAVIAPEAFEGMVMRLSELHHLRSIMPVEHFVRGGETSFQAELNNTEAALMGFDGLLVDSSLDDWKEKIAKGIHRVPYFTGVIRLQARNG